MSQSSRSRKILEFAVIFAIVYLLTQMGMNYFFPPQEQVTPGEGAVTLRPVDATVKGGHHPVLVVKNQTAEAVTIPDRCPRPPVDVSLHDGERWQPLDGQETVLPCVAVLPVAPGESVQVDLGPWKYSLFSAYGSYQATLMLGEQEATTDFSIHEAGWLTQVFRTFVSKPLLNLLVLIASSMPSYNLGFAIILLTILVKLILYIPTQHAMEGQKKMQVVQPKLEALKQKYKGDPKKMQAETMKLWKEHGVNPMQSCLPILIQFPVLIGLFFVIRDGSVLELSRHLLYPVYHDLSWSFNPDFFGMDLSIPSLYIMPPFLVVAQFLQMKLSFAIAKKKKESTDPKKPTVPEKQSAQEVQQKVMLYGLPLMIGFFAFTFPAAVSLYWGVSTIFAIGQQLVVNRRTLK